MLFVTHDMGAVTAFCHRAMLLDRGRVVDIGDPTSIARQYNEINFRRIREEAGGTRPRARTQSSAPAEVVNAWFESL